VQWFLTFFRVGTMAGESLLFSESV